MKHTLKKELRNVRNKKVIAQKTIDLYFNNYKLLKVNKSMEIPSKSSNSNIKDNL